MPPTRPSHPADRIDVLVDGRAVVALVPRRRRVDVGLVVPVLDRIIDVSVQPSAAQRAVEEAAGAAGVPVSHAAATAREALRAAAASADAWTPSPAQCLLQAFGGVAFPLLGLAFDQGAAGLAEVPRWAAHSLREPTIGRAAASMFGALATRPVRRAMVRALHPVDGGTVDLARLALALMGLDVLQPDRLARVLAAESAAHPTRDLPDPTSLQTARRAVSRWGDVRAERVLVGAAGRADGLRLLLDTTRYAHQLGDHGPTGNLPNDLVELHDAHRALVPSDGGPPSTPGRSRPAGPRRPRRAPVRRRSAGGPPAAAPAPQGPAHRLLPPPTATAVAVGADTALALTPSERALDGLARGALSLVVPRTVGDLVRWGRMMSNCLGDFGPAAAAGRSTIIGVRRDQRLVYAVELTPTGVVRQFCGRANRPPAPSDRRTVVSLLAERGVLDRSSPANRQWLADAAIAAPGERTG